MILLSCSGLLMFSCRNYEEKVGNRRIADETSDENCYDLYHRIINLIYNNVSKPPKFSFHWNRTRNGIEELLSMSLLGVKETFTIQFFIKAEKMFLQLRGFVATNNCNRKIIIGNSLGNSFDHKQCSLGGRCHGFKRENWNTF